jgi:hypothetical protein
MNPNDFLVDSNTVARLLAPYNQELSSFILVADIQIDERSVRFSPRVTHFLDKDMKIEQPVRGFMQDHADAFYFGYVLKAIRLGLEIRTKINFLLDLGDAGAAHGATLLPNRLLAYSARSLHTRQVDLS